MKQNISHMLEKAGITGLATSAISIGLIGASVSYQIPGSNMRIPLPILTAALGAANSFATDGIHLLLNKTIPLGKKTADRYAFFINAGVSGATFFALLYLIGSDIPYQYNPLNAFLTGSLGEMAGSAGYEYLLNNLYI